MGFQDLRAKAPPIHACDSQGNVTVLQPRHNRQERSADPGCIPMTGTGDPRDPYRTRRPSSLSDHAVVVCLWYRYKDKMGKFSYVKVGDWTFVVNSHGVRTITDGVYTRLG